MTVVVLGPAGRDLVLHVPRAPDPGGSVTADARIEAAGGKGLNQAVALAQLGVPVALVAVVGADRAGDDTLEQLDRDGVDASRVVRRGRTALMVDVVDAGGVRRLIEHVEPDQRLGAADVAAAADLLRGADFVSGQLQEATEVLLAAVRAAPAARVVLDGTPSGAATDELLRRTEVLRLDAKEAELLTGAPITDAASARRLLARGPGLVAVGLPDGGNVVVWPGGEALLPPGDRVSDPTGGGDSFTAGLLAALAYGRPPDEAARAAADAAVSTVRRLGGRPRLATRTHSRGER